MCCSKDAQSEEQYNDIDDQDADISEDEGCNSDVRIIWSCCPGDPQDVSAHARHAETEHGPGHVEFVTFPFIELKDALVGNGSDYVDEEEDGANGYILVNCGDAADRRNAGREVWRLRLQPSQSLSLCWRLPAFLTSPLSSRAWSMVVIVFG